MPPRTGVIFAGTGRRQSTAGGRGGEKLFSVDSNFFARARDAVAVRYYFCTHAYPCTRSPAGAARPAPRCAHPVRSALSPVGAGPGAGPRRDAPLGAGPYKQAGAGCRLRRFPAGEAGGSGRWFPRTPVSPHAAAGRASRGSAVGTRRRPWNSRVGAALRLRAPAVSDARCGCCCHGKREKFGVEAGVGSGAVAEGSVAPWGVQVLAPCAASCPSARHLLPAGGSSAPAGGERRTAPLRGWGACDPPCRTGRPQPWGKDAQ